MRIAVDLDGVLADFHTPFVRTAIRLFPDLDPNLIASADVGASPPADVGDALDDTTGSGTPLPSSLTLTRRQSESVWRQIASVEDFWETLDEIEPGSVASLARLADARGWEVLFITSRPKVAGRTVQRQSQAWLQARGFSLPSLYVVRSSRGRLAEALGLDVVVDDRPENCLDIVLKSNAGALLVWRGSDRRRLASVDRVGIMVVPTVASALAALVQADRAADRQIGMLDRLKRLFGLRPKPVSPLVRT
jgi:hypothetical protein